MTTQAIPRVIPATVSPAGESSDRAPGESPSHILVKPAEAMPTSKPQVAFTAAALVLLVMPLLVMFGLSALGFAIRAGTMSRIGGMMNGEAGNVVLTVFVVWVLLVVAVVLALVSRLIRRSARS
jgi:hypothetical protein